MTLDPGPAVYVGRPCYHGLGDRASCVPALWTSGRYSESVVTSMAAAVQRVVAARGIERTVWIGYSGGGVLAVLLAPRVPETVGLVTIAANLGHRRVERPRGHAPPDRLTQSRTPAPAATQPLPAPLRRRPRFHRPRPGHAGRRQPQRPDHRGRRLRPPLLLDHTLAQHPGHTRPRPLTPAPDRVAATTRCSPEAEFRNHAQGRTHSTTTQPPARRQRSVTAPPRRSERNGGLGGPSRAPHLKTECARLA